MGSEGMVDGIVAGEKKKGRKKGIERGRKKLRDTMTIVSALVKQCCLLSDIEFWRHSLNLKMKKGTFSKKH